MGVAAPRFLLFSDSRASSEPGRWRFVLRGVEGTVRLVVDDVEPDTRGERLELLTVIRGLEALDQPSQVTLMTSSTYVREGIQHGLSEWRRNDWRWEFFGQMVPIKNYDLWRRLGRVLDIHHVECRTWRVDPPHRPVSAPVGRRNQGAPGRGFSAAEAAVSATAPSVTTLAAPVSTPTASHSVPVARGPRHHWHRVADAWRRIGRPLQRWTRRLAAAMVFGPRFR
ncbi:MAG: RNase H family protein [Planctomycetota bacterium]|jgi:ribonuclease HI